MTLIRRAPREVYRVYAEHEFLADALCDEPLRTRGEAAGRRRLHGVAGATVLIATAGALGGVLALESLQSVPGSRRRERQRSAVATASTVATRAPHPSVRRGQRGRGRPARGSQGPRAARRPPDRVPSAGRRWPAREVASIPEPTPVRESAADPGSPPAPPGVRVAAASSPVAVSAAAGAGATREAGQSEFGFER